MLRGAGWGKPYQSGYRRDENFSSHLFDGTVVIVRQGLLSRIVFIWVSPFWFFSLTSGGKVTVLMKEKSSNLSALGEIAALNMLGFLEEGCIIEVL